jgi:HK97 family phage portal protein
MRGGLRIGSFEDLLRSSLPSFPLQAPELVAKRKKKSPKGLGYGSSRDLSALLNYGPQHVPYSAGWTGNRIEQIRVFRHWVYVAVHRIAMEVASKTPNVSSLKGAGDRDETSGERFLRSLIVRKKALTPLLSHQGMKPVRDTHPLVRLFQDPNEPDVSFDLWYETIVFLQLTGSFYWWIPRNAAGLPEAIWVLPSHWVRPVFADGGVLSGWELVPTEGSFYRKLLPADEVIVGRWKNPVSKIDGNSPAQAISEWVDTQNSVNVATNNAYRNGVTPTVAVQFDASINDPTHEQLRRIEQKFLLRNQGTEHSNRPLFLPPGVKVNPISILPNQMVFGDTAERTRDNILAAYAVPSIVAGIMKGATYGSILAAQTGFYAFCINPILRFLGQVLTEKLARLYDPNLRVWWEDFTPIDPAQRNADIKTMGMFGAITPDEVRIQNGFEPWGDEWGTTPLIPANMISQDSGGPGGRDDPDARPEGPDKIDLDEDNKKSLDETPPLESLPHRKIQHIERDLDGNISSIQTLILPLDSDDPDEVPSE